MTNTKTYRPLTPQDTWQDGDELYSGGKWEAVSPNRLSYCDVETYLSYAGTKARRPVNEEAELIAWLERHGGLLNNPNYFIHGQGDGPHVCMVDRNTGDKRHYYCATYLDTLRAARKGEEEFAAAELKRKQEESARALQEQKDKRAAHGYVDQIFQLRRWQTLGDLVTYSYDDVHTAYRNGLIAGRAEKK